MKDLSLDKVLARVLTSRRYRWVAEEVIERLAAEELPKARNMADAEKRTKRRLHQIFGAYLPGLQYDRVLRDLTTAYGVSDLEAFRSACEMIMSRHASTKERLPLLKQFYAEIFQITGKPLVLLDLACGLNPVATPWMGLPPDCEYLAYDIDKQLIGFIDSFLDLVGMSHRAELKDIITTPPRQSGDVALLLKAAPCLERQKADAGRAILQAVPARHLVVSYPTRSLSGIEKGMGKHYRLQFQKMVEGCAWAVEELSFPDELIFVITKET